MPATAPACPGAVDPRLLGYARATRAFLVTLILLGGITALLIIAQAWLRADLIATVLDGGKGVAGLHLPLDALPCAVLTRAAVACAREVVAHRPRRDPAVRLITHRLTGIEGVDNVIVLDGGPTVERGSHTELVALSARDANLWARKAEICSPP